MHCHKNLVDFRNNRGGSSLEGFPGNSRKHGIISSECWEISPPWDILPYNLGNLPYFGDRVVVGVKWRSTGWLQLFGTQDGS